MTAMIKAQWPAPENIAAFTTTRLFLDNDFQQLPSQPIILKQLHGADLINFDHVKEMKSGMPQLEADGSFTSQKNVICAVRTADCVPILICDKKGEWVAAVHAGWKGLQAGIIEKALENLPVASSEMLIWLGPFISQPYYYVREDMRSQFVGEKDDLAFKNVSPDQYLCDLGILARNRLEKCEIPMNNIYSADRCTFSEPETFYSYRRDGAANPGRLMSLIWRKR